MLARFGINPFIVSDVSGDVCTNWMGERNGPVNLDEDDSPQANRANAREYLHRGTHDDAERPNSGADETFPTGQNISCWNWLETTKPPPGIAINMVVVCVDMV